MIGELRDSHDSTGRPLAARLDWTWWPRSYGVPRWTSSAAVVPLTSNQTVFPSPSCWMTPHWSASESMSSRPRPLSGEHISVLLDRGVVAWVVDFDSDGVWLAVHPHRHGRVDVTHHIRHQLIREHFGHVVETVEIPCLECSVEEGSPCPGDVGSGGRCVSTLSTKASLLIRRVGKIFPEGLKAETER